MRFDFIEYISSFLKTLIRTLMTLIGVAQGKDHDISVVDHWM